jgi:hypothetical protein
MIYRKLDQSGDYSFGAGLQNFYQGAQAVGQAILTNLKLLQGEWWENTSIGLPLFQSILGKPGVTKDSIDMIVRSQILSTQDVSSIQSFSSAYNPQTRQYSISNCVVNTTSGAVTFTGISV